MELKVKKWGNSMAVIIPNETVRENEIRENDNILVDFVKPTDLSKIFGSLKGMKMSGQEFKDMVKKGWDRGD